MNYICDHNCCLTLIEEQVGKCEPEKATAFLRYKAGVNIKYKVTLNWKDIEENSINYFEIFFKNFCYFWNKQESMVRRWPEHIIFAGEL